MTRRRVQGPGNGWIGVCAVATLAVSCAPAGPAGGPPGRFGPAMEPQRTEYLNPGTSSGIPGFTTVVRDGSMVYVSGQVALDSEGAVVGGDDLHAQAVQAFSNLAHALRIAGAIPSEVLTLNIYVVDLGDDDLATIRDAGAEFMPTRNPPAGTVVGIARLPHASLRISVSATARVRAAFRPLR